MTPLEVRPGRRIAERISWVLAPLMVVASLAGLLWDGLYHRDAEWAQAAWQNPFALHLAAYDGR